MAPENCPKCNKSLNTMRSDNVKRHIRNCAGTKPEKNHTCECGKRFGKKFNFERHQKVCKQRHGSTSTDIQEQGEVQTAMENTSNSTQPTVSSEIKPQDAEIVDESEMMEWFDEEEQRNCEKSTWKCLACNKEIPHKTKLRHFQTEEHKAKAYFRQSLNIYRIKSCFGNKIVIYRIMNEEPDTLSMQVFLEKIKDSAIGLLEQYIHLHSSIKFQLEVTATFSKPGVGEEEGTTQLNFYINHAYASTNVGEIGEVLYKKVDELIKQMCQNTEEITTKGSNWTLSKIHHLDLHIIKHEILKGGSFIALPDFIRKKKACVNPDKRDEQCFKWCVLAYFLHKVLNPDAQKKLENLKQDRSLNNTLRQTRMKKIYEKLRKRLVNMSSDDEKLVQDKFNVSFQGLEFPTALESLQVFADANPDINLNVFGISAEDNHTIVGPLYASRRRAAHNINLLRLTNDMGQSHYVLIRDMSRFAAREKKAHRNQLYYCYCCMLSFNTEQQLKKHEENDCLEIVTELPLPGTKIKFEEFEKKIKAPIVVYADFECILVEVESEGQQGKTVKKHQHVPSSFAYLIKCNFDETKDQLEVYRGEDCGRRFVSSLAANLKTLYEDNVFNKYVPLRMTSAEEQQFQSETNCHICGKTIAGDEVKVRDHCHLTGKYRGAAHSECNTSYRLKHAIPVMFHNFSKYDAHLFMKELCQFETDKNISIIPSNTETYISVVLPIQLEAREVNTANRLRNGQHQQQVYLRLEFKDSFRFLTASIDALAKSLDPKIDFKNLKKFFPNNSDMLKRKGVFPYEKIKSHEDYSQTEFPTPAEFTTCLNDYDPISDEDYQFAKSVYETFHCQNLGEYSDLYLKTDVCILADIFEKFREECLSPDLYGLDPVHYYTSPGLAWGAMLKVTGVEIELIADLEMLNFFKAGIRGGLSQCSLRKAEAQNKYTHPNQVIDDPSYLIYLDVNNLYGWAMSQKLPIGEYEWVSEQDVHAFDVEARSNEVDYGYVLEADIEYPNNISLHENHNDLPFLPEKMRTGTGSVAKLVTTLNNKEHYVVHIANLKQALDHGLKLKKIHRALRFRQEAWLEPYIRLNTEARAKAETKTKKDTCKLMNNAVFGKTIESVENYRVIKLFNHWENLDTGKKGVASFMNSGYLKKCIIFDENFVAVELKQKVIKLNKPIQIGFTVLELAKTKMYEFHYDFMQKLYPDTEKLQLCYTDTDSMIYYIHTEDLYDDLKPFVHNPQRSIELFDTSDYPEDNMFGYRRVNKKVLGAMKDECAGKIMTTFIGLRAKCYTFSMLEDDHWENKAKGVKKHVAKKLRPDEYETCLLNRETVIYKKQHLFRSHMHHIFTEELNKGALNGNDDKRYIRNGGIKTFALGHRYICEEDDEEDPEIVMLEKEFLEN